MLVSEKVETYMGDVRSGTKRRERERERERENYIDASHLGLMRCSDRS
jgi:hypothetical protein